MPPQVEEKHEEIDEEIAILASVLLPNSIGKLSPMLQVVIRDRKSSQSDETEDFIPFATRRKTYPITKMSWNLSTVDRPGTLDAQPSVEGVERRNSISGSDY